MIRHCRLDGRENLAFLDIKAPAGNANASMKPNAQHKGISSTTFGRMLAQALAAQGREAHLTRSDGVFVRSREDARLHHFELRVYAAHGMLGPYFPRLNVNHGVLGFPKKLHRSWSLPYHGEVLDRRVGLEVTFLPEESSAIIGWIPTLLATIEDRNSRAWDRGFPFEIQKTTDTNFWSKTAHDHAKAGLRASGAFDRRSRT